MSDVRFLAALQAQRFLALVLLPHVRQDIRDNRRLHFALYQALKKAAYKPDAFYKVCPNPGWLDSWGLRVLLRNIIGVSSMPVIRPLSCPQMSRTVIDVPFVGRACCCRCVRQRAAPCERPSSFPAS